jgi:hypothetical protein
LFRGETESEDLKAAQSIDKISLAITASVRVVKSGFCNNRVDDSVG